MKILQTKEATKTAIQLFAFQEKTIGFVPTMGALHNGHLELVRMAKSSSDVVIVSIFVNPTQFNSLEDYNKYPHTLDSDLKLLQGEGVDLVFVPEKAEIYPHPTALSLDFGALGRTLEGLYRPGHFNGVGIVVSKLLNIVKPNKLYLGQKDLQQVAVIKRLISDFSYDVELVVVPTKREPDGLALSSRNLRLSLEEREGAVLLIRSLTQAKNELLAGLDWFDIREKITNNFLQEPLAKLEYFELVETDTLICINSIQGHLRTSICVAAYLGEVRLIDNLPIIH